MAEDLFNPFVTLTWRGYFFSALFLSLAGNPKTVDNGLGL
jgi:hypothetical protein